MLQCCGVMLRALSTLVFTQKVSNIVVALLWCWHRIYDWRSVDTVFKHQHSSVTPDVVFFLGCDFLLLLFFT